MVTDNSEEIIASKFYSKVISLDKHNDENQWKSHDRWSPLPKIYQEIPEYKIGFITSTLEQITGKVIPDYATKAEEGV